MRELKRSVLTLIARSLPGELQCPPLLPSLFLLKLKFFKRTEGDKSFSLLSLHLHWILSLRFETGRLKAPGSVKILREEFCPSGLRRLPGGAEGDRSPRHEAAGQTWATRHVCVCQHVTVGERVPGSVPACVRDSVRDSVRVSGCARVGVRVPARLCPGVRARVSGSAAVARGSPRPVAWDASSGFGAPLALGAGLKRCRGDSVRTLRPRRPLCPVCSRPERGRTTSTRFGRDPTGHGGRAPPRTGARAHRPGGEGARREPGDPGPSQPFSVSEAPARCPPDAGRRLVGGLGLAPGRARLGRPALRKAEARTPRRHPSAHGPVGPRRRLPCGAGLDLSEDGRSERRGGKEQRSSRPQTRNP